MLSDLSNINKPHKTKHIAASGTRTNGSLRHLAFGFQKLQHIDVTDRGASALDLGGSIKIFHIIGSFLGLSQIFI